MRILRALFVSFCSAQLIAFPALAMSSASYEINWDTISAGGDDFGTSANYQVHDTIGDVAAGRSSSASFQLSAGYRIPEIQNTVGFSVKAANSTPVPTWSSFNGVNQVTVSSAAGFTTGDFIAVVEDRGLSQKVAIGFISSVVGNLLTVNTFQGDHGAMSLVPAGGNDFVYLLDSNALNLGTITPTTAGAGVVGLSVFSTAPNGYAVYLTQNTDPQSVGLVTLDDVADTSVTIGSEEYGFSVTGPGSVLPNDNAIQLLPQAEIASGAMTPVGQTDKYGITFQAAVSSTTPSAVYSHTTYYTVTAKY